MANVLIEENTMSAIGNAIRAKTKKTDLIYPADMAEEIDGIVGGIPVEIITRELTEYSNSELEKIGDGAFAYFSMLTSVYFANVKDIGRFAFSECDGLTTVNFPAATFIGNFAFRYCYGLTEVNFPAAIAIGMCAFSECDGLTTVNFPAATFIGDYVFENDGELKTFIMRNLGAVCELVNKNAFAHTPIASGTGYIYVPSALIEDYKVATNWSTYATQFRALEDYTVDGTITGALDETKI